MEPSDNETEDEPFEPTGPTLNAEGKLESPARAAEAARRPRPRMRSGGPPPELELVVPPEAPALELEGRAARAEADYVPPPEPPKPRRPTISLGPWLALLMLGVLGTGGWYFFVRPKPAPPGRAIAVTILITSEPSGAAVSVEGTLVGVTPWAADNTWGPGPVNVSLTSPGYRSWSGTFPGARPARLEARLQRR